MRTLQETLIARSLVVPRKIRQTMLTGIRGTFATCRLIFFRSFYCKVESETD